MQGLDSTSWDCSMRTTYRMKKSAGDTDHNQTLSVTGNFEADNILICGKPPAFVSMHLKALDASVLWRQVLRYKRTDLETNFRTYVSCRVWSLLLVTVINLAYYTYYDLVWSNPVGL